jgi:hypothetical protein
VAKALVIVKAAGKARLMVKLFEVCERDKVPQEKKVLAFEAVITFPEPSVSTAIPEKVATPATAAVVTVPVKLPVPELNTRLTFAVESTPLVMTFSLLSRISRTG